MNLSALLHRHVWEIQEKLEQPSPAEAAREIGADLVVDTSRLDAEPVLAMHRRSIIVTSKCVVCQTERVKRI
jgi:hypothetical protein